MRPIASKCKIQNSFFVILNLVLYWDTMRIRAYLILKLFETLSEKFDRNFKCTFLVPLTCVLDDSTVLQTDILQRCSVTPSHALEQVCMGCV